MAQSLLAGSVVPNLTHSIPSGSATHVARTDHRLAFMPFGAGAHKCIGMHFAIVVVKAVIHHLLRDHRIEMRSGYTLQWDLTALPAPIDGFPLLVRRVDDSDNDKTTVTT